VARALIQRRLRKNARRLQSACAELAVTEEQLLSLTDDAEDLRLRALVSDSPAEAVEHHHADRHRQALARHRDGLLATIAELEAAQDELLDRLGADS